MYAPTVMIITFTSACIGRNWQGIIEREREGEG